MAQLPAEFIRECKEIDAAERLRLNDPLLHKAVDVIVNAKRTDGGRTCQSSPPLCCGFIGPCRNGMVGGFRRPGNAPFPQGH